VIEKRITLHTDAIIAVQVSYNRILRAALAATLTSLLSLARYVVRTVIDPVSYERLDSGQHLSEASRVRWPSGTAVRGAKYCGIQVELYYDR
jgi:hypothetical protein